MSKRNDSEGIVGGRFEAERPKVGRKTGRAVDRLIVSTKLDEGTMERLEAFVAGAGVSRSTALRLLLTQGLSAVDGVVLDVESVAWKEGFNRGLRAVWETVAGAIDSTKRR